MEQLRKKLTKGLSKTKQLTKKSIRINSKASKINNSIISYGQDSFESISNLE